MTSILVFCNQSKISTSNYWEAMGFTRKATHLHSNLSFLYVFYSKVLYVDISFYVTLFRMLCNAEIYHGTTLQGQKLAVQNVSKSTEFSYVWRSWAHASLQYTWWQRFIHKNYFILNYYTNIGSVLNNEVLHCPFSLLTSFTKWVDNGVSSGAGKKSNRL